MRVSVRNGLTVALGAGIALGALISTGSSVFAEPGAPTQVAPALITAAFIADPSIASDPTLLSDENVTFSEEGKATFSSKTDYTTLDPQLECMAKVVRHEAANQSRKGQRAVAEIIKNRADSGRFASTICGVANQPGQFFNTASYNPPRNTPQWRTAVDVSREVLAGEGEDVAAGAYFYHAAYQSPTRFFKTRRQVLAMGDHIFYR